MGYQQGLSGLDAASSQLDVIGNNIANASTTGFKQGTAEFADLFASSIAQSANDNIGIGTQVTAVAQNFTQGNITQTGNPLDVAINGGGFFQMSSNGTLEYTRSGQFQLNATGFIVNASGAELTGYPVNSSGQISAGTASPLQIPTTNIAPKQTGTVTAQFNLDSRLTAPSVTVFNPTNTDSFNDSSSVTVYDSLGNSSNLSAYFVKTTTPGVWNVFATNNGTSLPSQGTLPPTPSTYTGGTAFTPSGGFTSIGAGGLTINGTAVTLAAGTGPGGEVTANDIKGAINGTAGISVTASINAAGDIVLTGNTDTGTAITVTGTNAATIFGAAPVSFTGVAPGTAAPAGFIGTLTFNSTGALTSFANVSGTVGTTPGEIALTVPMGTGGSTTPQTINLNLTGTTQYGNAYTPNQLAQDGFTSGTITGFTIGTSGIIQGNYSNGESQTLGQIALATFNNENGLEDIGNNSFVQTVASGQPIVGAPGGTNLGTLQSGAVESSNVNLTSQLVDLIAAQRDYQADAQTIKTQQTVDQTLINI